MHALPTQRLWRLGEMVQRHLGGGALGLRERKIRSTVLTWRGCAQRSQERSQSELGARLSQASCRHQGPMCVAKVPWAKMKFFSFWCLFLPLLIADKSNEQMAGPSYGENLESINHTQIDHPAPSLQANKGINCLSSSMSTAELSFLLGKFF